MKSKKNNNKFSKKIYKRPESLTKVHTHYCPGCGHGIIHKLICEVVDELDIREKMIAIAPVGCGVFAYNYWDFDTSEAAHGRTPAVATGLKRVNPDKIVMSYQGDGDLAAIGTAEIIHAANRGENITVIFVNNAIYGMTGGQMAPTTLMKQRSTTTPFGREPVDGYPIRVCELLSVLEGTTYLERTSVAQPKDVIKTRRAIKKAFEIQIENKGFSLIEVLSMCPTNWKMDAIESCRYVEEKMKKIFPLGVIKDKTGENEKNNTNRCMQ
ncbi:2-oxoglutarate oxidoreductase [Candidatus Woesearchaeota archaeon]|nr:2-oxoglutarate oxidoreductase [Candidatus Woesearchaeota archaeon]